MIVISRTYERKVHQYAPNTDEYRRTVRVFEVMDECELEPYHYDRDYSSIPVWGEMYSADHPVIDTMAMLEGSIPRNMAEQPDVNVPDYDDDSTDLDWAFEKEARERRYTLTLSWIERTTDTKKLRNQWSRMWKAYNLANDRCKQLNSWVTCFLTKEQLNSLVEAFNTKGIYAWKDARSVDNKGK